MHINLNSGTGEECKTTIKHSARYEIIIQHYNAYLLSGGTGPGTLIGRLINLPTLAAPYLPRETRSMDYSKLSLAKKVT